MTADQLATLDARLKGLSLNVQRGAEMLLAGVLIAAIPGLSDEDAVKRVIAINQAMAAAGL